jgi:hypothetical protein
MARSRASKDHPLSVIEEPAPPHPLAVDETAGLPPVIPEGPAELYGLPVVQLAFDPEGGRGPGAVGTRSPS